MIRKKSVVFWFFLSFLILANTNSIVGQENPVCVGRLSNGLTYYVCRNGFSPRRCDFYLVRRSSSTLRYDASVGKFVFNTVPLSKPSYPRHGLVAYFDNRGYETIDKLDFRICPKTTIFRLKDVPVNTKASLDSALAVLYDWSREDIQTTSELFENYKNKAVVVTGDINLLQVEEKIRQLWRTSEGAMRKESNTNTIPTLVTSDPFLFVPESVSNERAVTLCFLLSGAEDTIKGQEDRLDVMLKRQIAVEVLRSRLDRLVLQSGSPIVEGNCYIGTINGVGKSFCLSATPGYNKEIETLDRLFEEKRRLTLYGVLPNELQKAKNSLLANYHRLYDKNKIDNAAFADMLSELYIEDLPLTNMSADIHLIDSILQNTGVEDMKNAVDEITSSQLVVVFGCGVVTQGDRQLKRKVVDVWNAVSDKTILPPQENETVTEKRAVKKIKNGKVKSSTINPQTKCIEWILRNNVRVVLCPKQNADDAIYMLAFSKGGLGYIETEKLPQALLTTDLVTHMGFGQLSGLQWAERLKEKNISLHPSLEENNEKIEGCCKVNDFDEMLQMLYLQTNEIRRDSIAFYKRLNQLQSSQRNNQKTMSQEQFEAVAKKMASDHSSRIVMLDAASIKKINIDDVIKIYKDRFGNIADFTFFFTGNINPQNKKHKEIICRWLGGIPIRAGSPEIFQDRGIRFPSYNEKQSIVSRNTNKNIIYQSRSWAYGVPDSLSTRLNLKILADILTTRYINCIENKNFGNCYIACRDSFVALPFPAVCLITQYNIDSTFQKEIERIVQYEWSKIYHNGFSEEEVQKSKEKILRTHEKNLRNDPLLLSYLVEYYIRGFNTIAGFENALKKITPQTLHDMAKHIENKGFKAELLLVPHRQL